MVEETFPSGRTLEKVVDGSLKGVPDALLVHPLLVARIPIRGCAVEVRVVCGKKEGGVKPLSCQHEEMDALSAPEILSSHPLNRTPRGRRGEGVC